MVFLAIRCLASMFSSVFCLRFCVLHRVFCLNFESRNFEHLARPFSAQELKLVLRIMINYTTTVCRITSLTALCLLLQYLPEIMTYLAGAS